MHILIDHGRIYNYYILVKIFKSMEYHTAVYLIICNVLINTNKAWYYWYHNIIIIIIRFRYKYLGNCRSIAACRDNYPYA